MMETTSIYQDMAQRTGGSVYIGVVGPVRTGKSTFVKRFMETLVLPHIENSYRRTGLGRTAAKRLRAHHYDGGAEIRTGGGCGAPAGGGRGLLGTAGRLRGVYGGPAVGQFEDLSPRMVMTPWFDHEIPMTEAAEIGTRKVITDHATVGIVVTTDGTITDIPREDYREAEERVIRELQDIGKPFVVLVNSAQPEDPRAAAAAAEIQTRYGVTCRCVNCLTLTEEDIGDILRDLLYQFPLRELDVFLPEWVDALPGEHPIRSGLYQEIGEAASQLTCICALPPCLAALSQGENIESAAASTIDLGSGVAQVEIRLPRRLFFETLSQRSACRWQTTAT